MFVEEMSSALGDSSDDDPFDVIAYIRRSRCRAGDDPFGVAHHFVHRNTSVAGTDLVSP